MAPRPRPLPRAGVVSLPEAEPELLHHLGPDERRLAAAVMLPLLDVGAGPLRLATAGAARPFAALIREGMVLQSVALGEHTGLRLLGPGDFITLGERPAPALVTHQELRATARTQLVLFGDEFLIATRRWPRLLSGLVERVAEQQDRQLAQMLICQLPRVDDRVLAILWLIAESWGHVTPAGTVVPVRLTHGALGGLIGARRSTVTLAVTGLVDRGALVRQPDGFLLLEVPVFAANLVEEATAAASRPVSLSPGEIHRSLDRRVTALQGEHEERRAHFSRRLLELRAAQERQTARRDRLMLPLADRPPRAPSSG